MDREGEGSLEGPAEGVGVAVVDATEEAEVVAREPTRAAQDVGGAFGRGTAGAAAGDGAADSASGVGAGAGVDVASREGGADASGG